MGIRLVGLALNPSWCVLSERARLVLVQMCYVARDLGTSQQAGGQYFGGHRALIISVLGKDPDALSESNLRTNEKYIQRAIQELKKAGAVTVVTAGARRHRGLARRRLAQRGADLLPARPGEVPGGEVLRAHGDRSRLLRRAAAGVRGGCESIPSTSPA